MRYQLLSGLNIAAVLTLVLSTSACRTFDGATDSDGSSKAYDTPSAPLKAPPLLPSFPEQSGIPAWGGNDPSKWRPEAVVANAVSAALNEAWSDASVTDALVAIAGKFESGWPHPYDDGQSNAMLHFNSWAEPRPPLLTVLTKHQNGSTGLKFRFDRELSLTATEVLLNWSQAGVWKSQKLPLAQDAAGDFVAEWSAVPAELSWQDNDDRIVLFIKPAQGFDDWFPVSFRYSVVSTGELLAELPSAEQKFSDGRSIFDAEGIKTTDQATAFENASSHDFSGKYNLGQNGKPYIPEYVHGQFNNSGRPVTAVGRGFTWVAEKANPFKILYTCFERRRPPGSSTTADFDEASAPDGGVVSGGGWHSIGEKNSGRPDWFASETIINNLERDPIVVATGFASPAARIKLNPPDHGWAYDLTDVAVVRWLWPDEALITVASAGPKNFHWFFFQSKEEVCTEEWVYPCSQATNMKRLRCEE